MTLYAFSFVQNPIVFKFFGGDENRMHAHMLDLRTH